MRGDIKRLVIIALSGVAITALLLGVLAPDVQAVFCLPAAPFGWLIAAVSLGVIGGLGWYLLAHAPRHTDGPQGYHAVACSSCGRAVLTDWRLCPYCGSPLVSRSGAGEEPARG